MSFWKKSIDAEKEEEKNELKVYKVGRFMRSAFIFLAVAGILTLVGYSQYNAYLAQQASESSNSTMSAHEKMFADQGKKGSDYAKEAEEREQAQMKKQAERM